MERFGNLDKGISAFRKEGNQYRELHEDKVAYASLNTRGEIQLEATPTFNDGALLDDLKHDRTHITNKINFHYIGKINNKYKYQYSK